MVNDQYSPRTFAEQEVERVLRKHRLLEKIFVGEGTTVPTMLELSLPRVNGTEVNIFTQYDVDKRDFKPNDLPNGKIFCLDVFDEMTPKNYNVYLDIRGNEFGVTLLFNESGFLREDVEVADYFDDLKSNQEKSIRKRISCVPHSHGQLFVPSFEEVLKLYKYYARD